MFGVLVVQSCVIDGIEDSFEEVGMVSNQLGAPWAGFREAELSVLASDADDDEIDLVGAASCFVVSSGSLFPFLFGGVSRGRPWEGGGVKTAWGGGHTAGEWGGRTRE